MVLLTVEGITDIESAEQMRNKVIFIDRNDVKLPQGSHFIEDLIGCEVLDTSTGKKLGELCNVSTTGANDVWHIQTENGKEYLIPAIPDVVDQVDIDARKVTITPLKGIFDDED